jgi:type IV secretion system protein TrbI
VSRSPLNNIFAALKGRKPVTAPDLAYAAVGDPELAEAPIDPMVIGKTKRRKKSMMMLAAVVFGGLFITLLLMDDKRAPVKKAVDRGEVEAPGVPSVIAAARNAAVKPDPASDVVPKVTITATGVKTTSEPKPPIDDKLGTPGYTGPSKGGKSTPNDEATQLDEEQAELAAQSLRNQLYSQRGEVTGLRLASPPLQGEKANSTKENFGSPGERDFQAQMEKADADGKAAIARSESLQKQLLEAAKPYSGPNPNQNANLLGNGLSLAPQRSANFNSDMASRMSQDTPSRVSRVNPPVSKVVSDEGTIIEAGLITSLNSQLPGKVLAQVTRDIYDSRTGQCKVVPAFSKLIGEYNSEISIGQERIFVAFSRLILPDGRTVNLAGSVATGSDGSAGMDAKINYHFWKQFGAAFAISAISLALPKDRSNVSVNVGASGSQSVGSVAAMTLSEVVRNILERNKTITPSASRENAFQFNVLVARDIAWEDKCY